ncbi:MAG: family 78 glycoside hydrolase catalytic domain [Phycisphaerae bacterium]|jgi:alpha-L-rhamnosidase
MTRLVLLALLAGSPTEVIATMSAHDATGTPPAPTYLRCEYLVNPLGVDETAPRLSWVNTDPRRGAAQTAYQILVADDPDQLAAGTGNLWDTGKTASGESLHITYAGAPLASRVAVWWQVRIWDQDDQPSPWSAPARWTMGLLNEQNWQAKWIGDDVTPPPMQLPRNGYHSEVAATPDAGKWLQIDLGAPATIDAVRLFPARPYNWREDAPGFLFPQRFRVEVSANADMSQATTIVDQTADDIANPGTEPQTYGCPPTTGRYVRLFVTTLRQRDPNEFGLALAEMQVLAAGQNVAAGKPVTASDNVEHHGWSTRYLVDDDLVSHGPGNVDPLTPPLLRKTFAVAGDAPIRRATLYATALGLYETRINGQRVGDRMLAPEWTDYHQRVQYQTYDVTKLLRPGDNVIGALLGDGWYAGRIGLAFIVPDGPPRALYGRQPRFLAQLEIERADGSIETIATDESWRFTSDGPIRTADILDGETYDARLDPAGWDAPGFDDAAWRPASVFTPEVGRLVAQPNEPIRILHEIHPISVREQAPGTYIFDLGQNMVGWCRLRVRGAAGDEFTLRHAEVLNPDGTLYTANLRSAAQTDRFILRGDGLETFTPHFTYHGFRYVSVEGLSKPPTDETLTGLVLHSSSPEVGEFACSDPMLNKLRENILWTQRANLYSAPTDCPQRDERLGWMGDILAFAQTGCFNMDLAAFFNKWLADVRDAQTADGRFPDFAPHPYDPAARFSGVPAWGDAGVFVPWCAWLNYGDRRLLAEHFDAARRWVDWIESQNPDLLWTRQRHHDYGDWLNADTLRLENWPRHGAEMPKEVFATAFFARSTQIVADMAAVLGRDDLAKHYAALAGDIRAAFNQAYVDADGHIKGDTQAGYAIALHFDLLPEALRPAATRYMLAGFDRYEGLISTGFHSTICLMNELTRREHTDRAYQLINERRMPSWGYAIDHGATTVWERWDGYVEGRGFQDPGMNSFSHYAIGSVGEWMVRTIIGINPDPAAPAYKHTLIRPVPGGGLTWARGAYDSAYGRITCAWRIDRGNLSLDVTIPANTTATIRVPTADPAGVTENGQPLAAGNGIGAVRPADGAVECDVAAGVYHFQAPWND